MTLISQDIASFKGGVSQQPDILRFPDQLQEQLNAFSSEVSGLQKRPPTVYLNRLRGKFSSDPFIHVINRDANEQYVLAIDNGNLEVWDLKGNKQTVNYADSAKSYLSGSSNDMRAVTVADYTFILNRKKVVTMLDTTEANPYPNAVLFNVRSAQYGKKYTIKINGVTVAGIRTPDGSIAKHSKFTTTTRIAEALSYALKGEYNTGGEGDMHEQVKSEEELLTGADAKFLIYINNSSIKDNYIITYVGDSVICIQKKDGSSFTYDVTDGFGGSNFLTAKNSVTTITKLPYVAPNNFVLKIAGESTVDSDDYYVKYNSEEKRWKEYRAYGVKYEINPDTMPHALVREADGTFTLKRLEWDNRESGDDDSNPYPTFIDNTISDIFFYRNRLGFISDENVILSETGSFFNFWFRSVATLLDSDTVDVAVSSNKVSILTDAVPYAHELLLFSREGQFVLGSDGAMTAKSVKADATTSFTYSPKCKPIALGRSIYFISNRSIYGSLMRYYAVESFNDVKDAEDVSLHIPYYLTANISRISGSASDSVILGLSDDEPNYVYVYKFILNNGQHLQQSWSKWTFPEDTKVLLAEFVDDTVYVMLQGSEGVFLYKMTLQSETKDFDDEPVRLYMDAKKRIVLDSSIEARYNDYTNQTEFNITKVYSGYKPYSEVIYVVDLDGVVQEIPIGFDGKIALQGNQMNKVMFIGRPYEFYVELSTLMIKQPSSTGAVIAENEGRLNLKYFVIDYNNSGVFDAHVTFRGKTYKYTNTGKYLGTTTAKLSLLELNTGSFKFPLQAENTDLTLVFKSDSVLPVNLTSGSWTGVYLRRSQRLS